MMSQACKLVAQRLRHGTGVEAQSGKRLPTGCTPAAWSRRNWVNLVQKYKLKQLKYKRKAAMSAA